MSNIDQKTVDSFGAEWSRFSQDGLGDAEHNAIFESYFSIFPWQDLPDNAEGFDMGSGSGRWAQLVARRVGRLNCVDPSPAALEVTRKNTSDQTNLTFYNSGVDACPLPDSSQDFGYSLGVLHHIPDTAAAMASCVRMLKPGAPFLVYLYFRFDNKPWWYSWLWRLSNIARLFISRCPEWLKTPLTDIIALTVYFPLARLAKTAEKAGANVGNWPLSSYRLNSFYTMRTDSRDRFGTPLEQRFTKAEIAEMMKRSGLDRISFSDKAPFWCAVGFKS
jgi:SAM-dependent methyltransferase